MTSGTESRIVVADSEKRLTQAAPTHAQLSVSFGTIASFSGRAQNFYRALAEVAKYLPTEGERCKDALQLVGTQRKWMFDVGVDVGNLVGTIFMLESNSLKELKCMWELAHSKGITPKMLKKNFRAAHRALSELAETRSKALALVEKCKDKGTEMAKFRGTEMKIQHAVMDVVNEYSGSMQSAALLEQLRDAGAAVQEAENQLQHAAESAARHHGKLQELSDKCAIYEAVAKGRKDSAEVLQARAKEIQQQSLAKSETAANTNNIPYRSRYLSFWWRLDWDNFGARADERASKFKQFAKDAQALADDKEQNMLQAAVEAASMKGQLEQARKDSAESDRQLRAADDQLQGAKKKLRLKQDEAEKLQEDFGGMSLTHIACLREHMQKFPELLGEHGTNDSGMFAAIFGALQGHKLLCDRIQMFLDEDDEGECKRLVFALKPMMRAAIDNATFFSQAENSLTNRLGHMRNSLATDGDAQALQLMDEGASDAADGWTKVDVELFDDEPLWD
mmetsp:Transcript_15987/g.36594  ORF Transcript_15987/g.36594 Transcript_15987/m.36594 type:complete len:507 (+) Transcript_15987:68-1588(+)